MYRNTGQAPYLALPIPGDSGYLVLGGGGDYIAQLGILKRVLPCPQSMVQDYTFLVCVVLSVGLLCKGGYRFRQS